MADFKLTPAPLECREGVFASGGSTSGAHALPETLSAEKFRLWERQWNNHWTLADANWADGDVTHVKWLEKAAASDSATWMRSTECAQLGQTMTDTALAERAPEWAPRALRVLRLTGAFFNAADLIVGENALLVFLAHVQDPQVKLALLAQGGFESLHAVGYQEMLTVLEPDPAKREALLELPKASPAAAKICNLFKSVMQSDSYDGEGSLAHRLVLFAAAEWTVFQCLFAIIFYFRTVNLFPAARRLNTKISEDERLHTDLTAFMYASLSKTRLSDDETVSMVRRVVLLVFDFIDELAEGEEQVLPALTCSDMKRWTAFTANHLLRKGLQVDRSLQVEIDGQAADLETNPIEYMEMISLTPATNFIEAKATTYSQLTTRPTAGAVLDGGFDDDL